MARLFSPTRFPPVEYGFVAVAINHEALHVALLFRLEPTTPVQILHLGWDHDLRNEEVSDWVTRNYLATTLAIGPLRSKAVAHYCLTVFEANSEGIPYAFGNPFGSFDPNGRFVEGTQVVGLTCASFVVAVLEQAGINIVKREGWGPNQDDPEFFKWVVRALKGEIAGVPAARRAGHAAAVEGQIASGAVRYRPLEVAGAATADEIPVSFQDAVSLGENLKPRLLRADEIPPYMRPEGPR